MDCDNPSVSHIAVRHWPQLHQLIAAHDPAHILLVGDDDLTWLRIASTLRREGFDVSECIGSKELLELVDLEGRATFLEHFDLVVADASMSTLNGLDILAWERQSCSGPPVVLILRHDDEVARERAFRLGASGTLDKPVAIHALLDKVHELLF